MSCIVALIVLVLLMICSSTGAVGIGRKSVFLLAGQSNMSGRGGVLANGTWDGVVPPECQPNPLISRLNGNQRWEEAQEPLHSDIDLKAGTVGVGPGMPFATTLLAKYPSIGEIGLVPCAQGGTNITQWSRGSELYNFLVARAKAAVNLGGCLRGILWYQGEQDCNDIEPATLYKARFEQFVRDIRSDLLAPLLPVIEVAITSGGKPELREILRAGQFQSARELAEVRCVDANGLALKQGDAYHLTTEAQVKLGTMMADAYLVST